MRGRELGDYSGIEEKRLFQEERNGQRVKCCREDNKVGVEWCQYGFSRERSLVTLGSELAGE